MWAQSATPASPNSWQISGQLRESVDSNVLLALQKPKADSSTQLQLALSRTWLGSRWSLAESYVPQATLYGANSKLDYLAQAFNQNLGYNLSPHTRLSWSTNLDRYPERGGAPQAGVAGLAATLSAGQPLAQDLVLTNLRTSLDLNHQYSLRGSWSAGFTLGRQGFSSDTAIEQAQTGSAAPLRSHSDSIGGSGNWSYRLGPARTLSLGGSNSLLATTNPRQRLDYSNLQASITQQLGSVWSLQAGAGPAFTRVISTTATGYKNTHSYAANARLSRQLNGREYGLAWQHADQLGQIPGGLSTDMLALQLSQQWRQNWNAGLSLERSNYTSLLPGVGASPTEGTRAAWSVSGQAGYQNSNGWTVMANLSYLTQTIPVVTGQAGRFRRLQGGLGISYQIGGAH